MSVLFSSYKHTHGPPTSSLVVLLVVVLDVGERIGVLEDRHQGDVRHVELGLLGLGRTTAPRAAPAKARAAARACPEAGGVEGGALRLLGLVVRIQARVVV